MIPIKYDEAWMSHLTFQEISGIPCARFDISSIDSGYQCNIIPYADLSGCFLITVQGDKISDNHIRIVRKAELVDNNLVCHTTLIGGFARAPGVSERHGRFETFGQLSCHGCLKSGGFYDIAVIRLETLKQILNGTLRPDWS